MLSNRNPLSTVDWSPYLKTYGLREPEPTHTTPVSRVESKMRDADTDSILVLTLAVMRAVLTMHLYIIHLETQSMSPTDR